MMPAATAAPADTRFKVNRSESTFAHAQVSWERDGSSCTYEWKVAVAGLDPLDTYNWKTGQTEPTKDTEGAKNQRGPTGNVNFGGGSVPAGTTVTIVAHIEDTDNPKDSSHSEVSFTC